MTSGVVVGTSELPASTVTDSLTSPIVSREVNEYSCPTATLTFVYDAVLNPVSAMSTL